MNLNAYDTVEISLNMSYVRTAFKRLYSSEIKYHKYYGFLSRYDQETDKYDVFIVLTNNPEHNPEVQFHQTIGTIKTKELKFDIAPIFNVLSYGKNYNFKVFVCEHDVQDDGIVYKLTT